VGQSQFSTVADRRASQATDRLQVHRRVDQVRELILQAGMDLGLDRNDREVVRVERLTAGEKVPASSLIIERRSTTYYSFDPKPRVRKSRSRRGLLDKLMRDQVIEQAEHQAPLIPAG
jgi:hypothetical protein